MDDGTKIETPKSLRSYSVTANTLKTYPQFFFFFLNFVVTLYIFRFFETKKSLLEYFFKNIEYVSDFFFFKKKKDFVKPT